MGSREANCEHDGLIGDPIPQDEFDDFELDGPGLASCFVGSEDDDIMGILREA